MGDERFDFNTLVPMPQELEGTRSPSFFFEKQSELFKGLFPEKKLPQDLTDEELLSKWSNEFKTIEEVREGRLKSQQLKEKYGFDNWYDWCIKNWGTKWNSYNAEVILTSDYLKVYFNTAWSLPEPIYDALVEQFPNFEYFVEATYEGYDEGENYEYNRETKEWMVTKTKLAYLHPETGEHLILEPMDNDDDNYQDQFGNVWSYDDDVCDMDTEMVPVV